MEIRYYNQRKLIIYFYKTPIDGVDVIEYLLKADVYLLRAKVTILIFISIRKL